MSKDPTRRIAKWTKFAARIALGLSFMVVAATNAKEIARPDPVAPPPGSRPVDLVICLDTSGSMTALIDSARAKLWDIVNELAQARPTPRLRVGLLTYGTPSNSSAAGGWIVRQTDLTDDLDTVYAKMMAMSTSGGDEFVGWVLNDALRKMAWSSDPQALKIIFVAGNESADQAREHYDFRYVADYARANGIVVNSIYAGNRQQGIAENWHLVAQHGGGRYSAIDTRQGTIQIPTPMDDALYKLNLQLNATYVPFGSRGRLSLEKQSRQDANAATMGVQSEASRVAAKASDLYRNTSWDLVDASKEKDFDLAQVGAKDLPEPLRTMSPEERRAFVNKKAAARRDIQDQIKTLSAQREAFLRAARQQHAGPAGLDDAILEALREQAQARGFEFNSPPIREQTPKGE